ncbi:flagellar hook-associated protein FlgK [Bacillus cereus]|nr:flagellar hook-associated protein FlgK [Bacillus cereus]PGU70468.1 flagellar hook-associated protein FlgK [Bacillus cereus]
MKLSDYNTPLSGLLAAQIGLQTTQQNLSNINTPGYVRQRVNYASAGPSNAYTPGQQIGYGVQTVGVDRITNEVKTKQFNEQQSQFAYYAYMNSTLSRVESMVGTTGENSLSSLMDGFFNSFHEIVKQPKQSTAYNTLIAETNKFTNQVNLLAKNFGNAEVQVANDIEGHVNEFNRLAQSLAEANKKIGQAGSHVPNQLLDERDRIITEMSQYANIEVSYESTNPNIASVRIEGVLTVNGQDTYPLQLQKDKDPITVQISGKTIPLNGGAISAAIDTKEKIVGYKKELEEWMLALKDKVNTVMGKDFFVGDTAGNIRLNPEFEGDISKMEISAEIANEIAGIRDQPYKDGISFKEGLDKLIVGVASDKNAANSFQDIHEGLLNGIYQEKMSLEGVNMEEEMVNLMAFQKYFVANSKAINTMNEVFDSIFSLIR